MSEIRVNLLDAESSIHGELHGSMTDALVASLTAEPETIDDFKTALERFVKIESDWKPLRWFKSGENLEPYDAGVLAVDLAARVMGVESTYSDVDMAGSVRVDSEFGDFGADDGFVYIPYKLPADWLIIRSIPLFEGTAARRRLERAGAPAFDARPVMFGRPMIEFLALEMAAADDLEAKDLFTEIHAKWLMTPREDLRGKTPREMLFLKRKLIDFDLHSRSLQYSATKLCPRPIPSDSFAYLNAGFGTHEWVMYYDLIREVLGEAYDGLKANREVSRDAEIDRLRAVKDRWLTSPDPDSSGRIPADIIETERKRLNLTMSAQDCLIDDDCPLCVAMYEDFDTPGFWHYDGCNMDDRFEFSVHETREEYEEEQREWERRSREWDERKLTGDADRISTDEAPF